MKSLKVLGILLFATALLFLNGWVLVNLWAWFVTPIFGLRNIALHEAMAICLVVGYLTHANVPLNKKCMEEKQAMYCGFVSRPLVTLAVGAILHRLVF